jgi:hypothetical protein
MREVAQISPSFPTARCEVCDRYVLTHVAFDGDAQSRRCVHCDSEICTSLRWISAPELESEGYHFGAPTAAGGGCGSGCGSCSVRRH